MLFGDKALGCISKENDSILKCKGFKTGLRWGENGHRQWQSIWSHAGLRTASCRPWLLSTVRNEDSVPRSNRSPARKLLCLPCSRGQRYSCTSVLLPWSPSTRRGENRTIRVRMSVSEDRRSLPPGGARCPRGEEPARCCSPFSPAQGCGPSRRKPCVASTHLAISH